MNPNDHPHTICQLNVRLAPEAPDEVYVGADMVPATDLPEPLRRGWETHDLIYTDGNIALTVYETCHCLWFADTGTCMGGSLWKTPAHYVLTPESHLRLLAHAVGVRRVDEASAATVVERQRHGLAAAERSKDAERIATWRRNVADATRCHAFRRERLARLLRVEANARERAEVTP